MKTVFFLNLNSSRKSLICGFLLLLAIPGFTQDLTLSKKMLDTLTSVSFWGRGYTKNGMQKAAGFLADQLKSYGLQPLDGKSFFQDFSYPVNTFPDDMEVSINGKELIPGKDFIIAPDSRGGKGRAKLIKKDSVTYVDADKKIIVSLKDKLTWSVAPGQADFIIIQVDKKSISGIPSNIKFEIVNQVINDFHASNICGIIRGTRNPDSVIVLSGHYDHLGGMGEDVYFPGANDNASGISLLLNLARYYSANPQPYSIVFMLFAGEEAGLIGSKYYTEHPLFPIDKIRFLINLDLVGTGDEGITVVNGLQYAKEYAVLIKLNEENKYLVKVNARGKAANSDHFWFSEKGVPAFFIYTMGGIRAYHDVFDRPETLPLNEHEDLFRLIVKFNERLML